MRTCSRYTRACLVSTPLIVLQCCVARLFYMLSSLCAYLLTLNSGASKWRWPMGLLALASCTAHKELAPALHTRTLGDGSGDAHLQQTHKNSLNIHPLSCVAMLRCSRVLYVVLLVCTSSETKQWR